MGRGYNRPVHFFAAATLLAGALLSSAGAWGEPDWVKKRPQDPDYYIGIGVAARSGKKADYREKARLAALRDLASEITVTIDSTFLMRVTETTGLTEEEVRDETRATVQARLEEVEFVDDHKVRGELWVYYRLSRQAYRTQRADARRAALVAARTALADTATPVAAIRAHLQALAHLYDFVGEPEPKQWIGGSVLRAVDQSHAALRKLLGAIRLTGDRASLYGLAGGGLEAPLVVSVHDANQQPLAGIPLRFAMSGTGALTEKLHSDSSGRAACHIGAVSLSSEAQIIRAALDLERLSPEQLPAGFFTTLVERLPVPQVTVLLKVFGPAEKESYLWHRTFGGRRVYVLAAYRADGAAREWLKMRDELAAHIQQFGGTLAPVKLSADAVAALPASPVEARRTVGADAGDVIVLAVADGRLNRRAGATGEAVAFAGTIRTRVARDDRVSFTDAYQGAGGFNPMGEAMCMDVLGLHAIKRWRARYLAQLGEGK